MIEVSRRITPNINKRCEVTGDNANANISKDGEAEL